MKPALVDTEDRKQETEVRRREAKGGSQELNHTPHSHSPTHPLTHSPPTSRTPRSVLLLPLALAALTFALYLPAIHFDFVQYDDNDYVFDNQTVRAGLTWWGLVWSFVDAHALNWHPVTWLSHMLDCQLFGLNPGAHHLVNVLFHCANTALLFILLRTLTAPSHRAETAPSDLWALGPRSNCVRGASPSPAPEERAGESRPSQTQVQVEGRGERNAVWSIDWRCAFAAALFAWHPLRVESVAWISERKDVLSGFFFMLTVLMYAKYVRVWSPGFSRSPSQFSIFNFQFSIFNLPYYVLSLAFFTLGLLSKSMLVTVPFILLLLDLWPLGRFATQPPSGIRHPASSLQQLLCEKIPFFALSVAVAIITFFSQHSGGAVVSLHSEGIGSRIATALAGYLGYLEKTLWPRDLVVIYLRPSSIPAVTIILGAAILLAISAWALRATLDFELWTLDSRLRRPTLHSALCTPHFVGWLWFLIMLLPVCGLVQVGPQLIADRYTYLPSIGPAILLAWSLLSPSQFSIFNFQFSIFNPPTPSHRAVNVAPPTADCGPWTVDRGPQTLDRGLWALDFGLWTSCLAVVILIACAVLTHRQLGYWRNTETLMTHALAVAPNNYIAHQDLAVYYSKLGQIDAARAHRQKARELEPVGQ